MKVGVKQSMGVRPAYRAQGRVRGHEPGGGGGARHTRHSSRLCATAHLHLVGALGGGPGHQVAQDPHVQALVQGHHLLRHLPRCFLLRTPAHQPAVTVTARACAARWHV